MPTMTRQQRKLKARQLESANKKLSLLTGRLLSIVDRDIERHIAADPELKRHISCTQGCAACCNQMVKITIGEATHITQTFPAEVERAMPEIKRQAALMEEMGLNEIEESKDMFSELSQQEKHAQTWFRTQTPCAFLDKETKNCRIYAARPLVCRGYYVVQKGPSVCAEIPMPGETDFVVPGWEAPSIEKGAYTLLQMQNEVVHKAQITPIPQAILDALDGKWRADGS